MHKGWRLIPLAISTHSASTGCCGENLNTCLSYTVTYGGQLMNPSMFYPSHASQISIHWPPQIECLVRSGGKYNQRTWNQLHATAINSFDCAATSFSCGSTKNEEKFSAKCCSPVYVGRGRNRTLSELAEHPEIARLFRRAALPHSPFEKALKFRLNEAKAKENNMVWLACLFNSICIDLDPSPRYLRFDECKNQQRRRLTKVTEMSW